MLPRLRAVLKPVLPMGPAIPLTLVGVGAWIAADPSREANLHAAARALRLGVCCVSIGLDYCIAQRWASLEDPATTALEKRHLVLQREAGRLERERVFLVGASGGAIASAAFTVGIEPDRLLDLVKELASTVNKQGIWGKVREPLTETLQVRYIAIWLHRQ